MIEQNNDHDEQNYIVYKCFFPVSTLPFIVLGVRKVTPFKYDYHGYFTKLTYSEFGRVCERRKLRVNVGKRKVMRCSRYGNGDRMHVILNGEPLEEVDCFKYL